MKQMKNNIIKTIILLTFIFISSCSGCGFSERCHIEREREKFLMLSPEQQRIKREECMKWVPVSCYAYTEPTQEELKKLKVNDK